MANISEPVLTIAGLLKDSPERFRMKESITDGYITINVFDSVTSKQFEVFYRGEDSRIMFNNWMTWQECNHLGKIVAEVRDQRIARELNAAADKERQEWLSAYKNKEK